MDFGTDYYDLVKENEEILPKIIDKKFIEEVVHRLDWDNDAYSNILRFGISDCDVSNIDMSKLPPEYLKKVSFSEGTVFSVEQIKRFQPDKIIEECKEYYENMKLLHKAGINGEGINVVVIDNPCNLEIEEFQNVLYNDDYCKLKGENEFHANAVLSALMAISPEANITLCARAYLCDDEKDEEKKIRATKEHRDEAIAYLQDILDGKIEADVVSMSSSLFDDVIGDNMTKELYDKLAKRGCVFLDSDTTEKDFWYCNQIDKVPYVQELRYNITDEQFEEMVKQFNINYEKIEKGIYKAKTPKEKEEVQRFLKYYSRIKQSKEEFEKVINELNLKRYQGDKVILASGGITITTNDNKGGKMYSANGCNSWTTPQIAGFYAIAKQMAGDDTKQMGVDDMNYDGFVKTCIKTATKSNINGINMINPVGLVREINEMNKQKALKDPRYVEIYEKSSKLIANLDRELELAKNEKSKD